MQNALFTLLRMGNTPEQIIQNVISVNPQANILLNQMRQSGMSAKDFVMQYAKQNNIQLQPILSALQQVGIKL